MRKLLINVADLAPQNISTLVLLVGGGVWLVLWFILFADVIGREKSVLWKIFWLPVCSVPILGGILYSLADLLGADWRAAFAFRQHDANNKNPKKKKNRVRQSAKAS